ncbi:MAG TPA: glycoside hydrolase family 2 TIM barrel-domain containing protein [Prolixibacteraceae bacterium]|nr:glycoside hydrolase family 2 TIM barrel-domain containing protein [Prolixibacteraceae bacterium]
MKCISSIRILFLFVLGFYIFHSCINDSPLEINRNRLFDSQWKFMCDSITGAEQPTFDDSNWRTLDLPHDWSIEDLPGGTNPEQIGPFSKKSAGGFATGHTVGGIGWYRKQFTLDRADAGKSVGIQFDGIFNESDVWLNGKHVGFHPNGYTSFVYDLTSFLNPADQPNLLAVRVKNIGKTCRWYSGSGIYRHVWLSVTNPVHIAPWGVWVTTPSISKESSKVELSITIENSSDKNEQIQILTNLIDASGVSVAHLTTDVNIKAGSKSGFGQELTVNVPQLWSPASPSMYKAEVKIKKGNQIIDEYTQKFGIRNIIYSAEKGLLINGESIKLRGGCMHQDNGILGSAAIDRAEERRSEIMKANGFNAIRCSHNLPSPKFLETCDSLGMLVIDECFDVWNHSKVNDDYSQYFKEWWHRDMENMLIRDRNHPSVIFWSIGNEIRERADAEGLVLTKEMTDFIHQYDTSRPITEAVNEFIPAVGDVRPWSYSAPAYALLDVGGYNYPWRYMENDHKLYPNRIMMTTESFPVDMFDIWEQIKNSPHNIGDFVWTGMDYLGESGIGHVSRENGECNYAAGNFGRSWPWFVSGCGDIDINGFKKAQSYYRDVLWDRSQMEMLVQVPDSLERKQMISLWGWYDEIPCWTWPGFDGKKITVDIYTRCTSVRLELNGKVIDEKKVTANFNEDKRTGDYNMKFIPKTQLTAQFEIHYEAGELKAIGLVDGKVVVSKMLKTARAPKKLVLTVDRNKIKADRNDLAYVTVEVADENGNIIPNATIPVNLTIEGDGELAAAGNASPNQMTSFRQPKCNLYQGKAIVILRPSGKAGNITLKAGSSGLTPASVVVMTL